MPPGNIINDLKEHTSPASTRRYTDSDNALRRIDHYLPTRIICDMETLAGLGLAGNIVQFIDFSGKVLKKARKIYQSRDSETDESTDFKLISNHLLEALSSIQKPKPELPSSAQPTQTNAADKMLEELRGRCCQVGSELIAVLTRLEKQGGATKWKSFKQALSAEWKSGQLEKMQERLTAVRDEILFHIALSLKSSVSVLAEDQAIGLRALRHDMQTLTSSLSNSHSNIKDNFTSQNTQLGRIESSIKSNHSNLIKLGGQSHNAQHQALRTLARHQAGIAKGLEAVKDSNFQLKDCLVESIARMGDQISSKIECEMWPDLTIPPRPEPDGEDKQEYAI
ncbi:hypothetical protein FDECE_1457 [Fusarium decemcellulare]|nr:hypothetical protein FDECE_1457 [Fusarium decemcellulare]